MKSPYKKFIHFTCFPLCFWYTHTQRKSFLLRASTSKHTNTDRDVWHSLPANAQPWKTTQKMPLPQSLHWVPSVVFIMVHAGFQALVISTGEKHAVRLIFGGDTKPEKLCFSVGSWQWLKVRCDLPRGYLLAPSNRHFLSHSPCCWWLRFSTLQQNKLIGLSPG